ncbi:MAG TPA: hypothetical protein VLF63_02290, partial [Patescibacteria group bacterium]|nr:hypothetical protein [Patescibacteria group bacterium]
MTKHKGFWLITCFIAVAIAFAISNFALSNNFLAALDATDNKIVKCKNLGETHTVIIQNNQV